MFEAKARGSKIERESIGLVVFKLVVVEIVQDCFSRGVDASGCVTVCGIRAGTMRCD